MVRLLAHDGNVGEARKLCVVCATVYRGDVTTCPNDGAMLVIEAGGGGPARLGHVLGNYRLLRLIGEGGVGTVYEGVHVQLGRKMALKVLHADATAEAVTRFFNEARAVNEIRHPNILEIEDFVSTETGDHYLLMELLEGEDLRAVVRREGVLAADRVTAIGEQLAGALAAVHAVGIVHRDLKPDNIFMARRDGQEVCKLVDFGIAKFVTEEQGLTRAGMTLGTPEYMAPEQIVSDGQPGPRTDIYALGMVLYECLAGAPAFNATTTAGILRGHLSEPVVPPSVRRGEPIAPVLEAVVLKCLAKDPDHRFASADDLRVALGADQPVAAPVEIAPEPPPTPRVVRRRAAQMFPAFVMAAAALVLHVAPRSHAAPARAQAAPAPAALAPAAPAPAAGPTPSPPPAAAPAPPALELQLASEPEGAELFVGAERTAVGRAPVTTTIGMSSEPIQIVARFADGGEVVQAIVPDRPLSVLRFVERRAPEPKRPITAPRPTTPSKPPDREGTMDPFK